MLSKLLCDRAIFLWHDFTTASPLILSLGTEHLIYAQLYPISPREIDWSLFASLIPSIHDWHHTVERFNVGVSLIFLRSYLLTLALDTVFGTTWICIFVGYALIWVGLHTHTRAENGIAYLGFWIHIHMVDWALHTDMGLDWTGHFLFVWR